MKSPRTLYILLAATTMLLGQACSKALVIENVNYSQPIESVMVPDKNGVVSDMRYGISFNVQSLEAEEFEDDTTRSISTVRMIRNASGYYFITANNFRHVYVMAPKKGELKEIKKVLVSEEGISNPAFNWREPMVELIHQQTDERQFLTENGLVEYKEEQS